MNKEIKEIRDYISCPQFGDDYYGKWGTLRLDQRRKIKDLIDYITNLEQENERLKSDLELYENGVYFSSENDKLQEIIDKAIEYIKKHKNTNPHLTSLLVNNEIIELENILKGE